MKCLIPLLVLFVVAGCSGDNEPTTTPTPSTTSAPYSQTDLVVGTGAVASPGNTVTVAYTGWLHDSSRLDAKGTPFDSQASFSFALGRGEVIRGWDQGVAGMRVGGQRRLVIPPELAYGSSGRGTIPPNATLVFDITLNSVR